MAVAPAAAVVVMVVVVKDGGVSLSIPEFGEKANCYYLGRGGGGEGGSQRLSREGPVCKESAKLCARSKRMRVVGWSRSAFIRTVPVDQARSCSAEETTHHADRNETKNRTIRGTFIMMRCDMSSAKDVNPRR